MDILYDLLVNILLLFALIFLLNIFNIPVKKSSTMQKIVVGFSSGVFVVLLMMFSGELAIGIHYDTRTVLLSVTGLFFGPISAVIGTIFALLYRLYEGGVGTLAGILSIVTSAGIGVLWHKYLYGKVFKTQYIEFLLFGFFVHLFMLISQFTLPYSEHKDTILFVAYFLVPIYTLATMALCYSIVNHEKRMDAAELHSRYIQLFNQSSFGLIQYDQKSVILFANDAAANMFQLKPKVFKDFCILNRIKDERITNLVRDSLKGITGYYEGEYTSVVSGETRYVRETYSPTISSGKITGGLVVIEDLSELNQYKNQLAYMENKDVLTGLMNRQSFFEHLQNLSEEETFGSIVLIDINSLRIINEVESYESGNKLIIAIAKLIKNTFPNDSLIARYDGDEFIVFIPNCRPDHLSQEFQTLKTSVDQLHIVDFSVSISIGTASNCDVTDPILTLVNRAEKNLHTDRLLNEESSSNAVIQSLKTTLYERSDETEQHAERMKDYCKNMAKKLDLSSEQENELILLAMLHDIGKIGISDTILKKPGPLTKKEYEVMKQHPSIGYRMAKQIPQIESIAYPILCHHEWYNGEGYPNQLQKEEIPLIARIVSVIDAYDAITSDRVYQKARSQEEAIKELKTYSGTQFDPDIVRLFLDLLQTK